MNTKLKFFSYPLLLLTLVIPFMETQKGLGQGAVQQPKALASETFNLASDMEVGLEIETRSPGASWIRKGC